MAITLNGSTGIVEGNIADNAITANKIATGAITVADIPNGEITAAKLHTTAITDKLGFTPISNTVTGSFGAGVSSLSSQVPNSLQFNRVCNQYTAGGGMQGSSWINTGINFNATHNVYAIVDAIGNENNRNQGLRRFFISLNTYDGARVVQIYSYNQGNDYGLVDVQMSGTQIQIKAYNNTSGGNWRLYVYEYIA